MKKLKLFTLLITNMMIISGCNVNINSNSSSDNNNKSDITSNGESTQNDSVSLSSEDDNEDTASEIILDSQDNSEISDEMSSDDNIQSDDDSEIIIDSDVSSVEDFSGDIISDSDNQDTSDNSSSEIIDNGEINEFILYPANFKEFKGIEYTNFEINSKYPDEIALSPNGQIKATSAFENLDSIMIHVYGTYDNLIVSNENGTITPTIQNQGEGNKTSVKYTYNFNNSSSFLIENPSSYVVNIYSITVKYYGDITITLPVEPEIPDNPNQYSVGWTNNDFGNYYQTINENSIGTNLLSSLQKLNNEKRKKTIGYSGLWNYFDQTDYDPNNKSKYIAFYNGTSASQSEMNKEHVWPNSRGGNYVDGDIHMTRPTLKEDNSSRGNSFYVENRNSTSSGWDPKTAGMDEKYRGIAARIIFYCVVADSRLSLVDLENDATSNNTMGKLSDLLRWNLMYPVDASEHRRNVGAQNIQGNRNPFIDNTSFACAIWGNTNQTTKKICGNSHVDDNVPEDGNENQNPPVIDDNNDNNDDVNYVQGSYKLVTTNTELTDGKYIIVNTQNNVAAASYQTKYFTTAPITITSNVISSLPDSVIVFDIKNVNGNFNISCKDGILGATSAKYLAFDTGEKNWKINIDSNNVATIENANANYGKILYNHSASRFLNYTSNMLEVSLYKQI